MPIGTDATIKFHGTADQIHNSPATVANAAFSVAGDVTQWTNDDDAPWAYFELRLVGANLSGTPSAGASIDLFTRLMDLRATPEDQNIPQANFEHYYLGSFPVLNSTAVNHQVVIGQIAIPVPKTSQVHEFYIKNNLGVATGTGWELWIIPVTFGPHP